MKPSNKSTSKSQVNYFRLTLSYWMKVLNVYICVAEFVGSKTIEMNYSLKRTQGNVTLWIFSETRDIFFLPCYTTSFSMLLNDCWSFERRMAKILFIQSVAWRQHYHSASSTVSESLLDLLTAKAFSRWRVQEVYPWSPTSGDNVQVQICRPHNVTVELWIALPVLQMAVLLPKRRLVLAIPMEADIIINFFCSWPNVSCFCSECAAFKFKLPQGAGGPAGCRPAGRLQAGTKQLHIVCTLTCKYVRVCALLIMTKNRL